MKFCPSCGAKKLREQDRFCMNCGEPYPVLADEQPTAAAATEQAAETLPAEAAPAVQAPAPESVFEAPAPVPDQTSGAAHVQPSKLAATAESAYAASQPTAAPPVPESVRPSPAFQPPAEPVQAAPEPVLPKAEPPVAPVQQPVAPVQQEPAQPAMPQNLFDVPATPAQPAAQEVEAEAAFLRDSIDKMLGGEPEQAVPAAQPQNLFDTGMVDTTGPTVADAPFAGNVFDGVEEQPAYEAAVFEDETVQYDEYGNPIAAEEEAGYGPVNFDDDGYGVQTADDTLGFGAVEDSGSLFEEQGAGGNDNLFAGAHNTPRQQQYQEPPQQREVPRRQRVDDLSNAVQSAAGPDTEKWQRLQQDDNLQDLYAREERKKKPPEIPLPEYSEKKSKKRGGGSGRTVGIIITAVIVFVVGTLGATMGLLYYRNSPTKAIDAFIEGIEDRNYTGLNGMVELDGVEGTTDGWAAFCDAFESTSAKRDLQNQLKNQAKKGATGSDDYPAVVMESEPLFLFVKRYYITIQAVDLLAEGIIEVDGSTINGLFMKGTSTDQGRLYPGMMPGRYTYEIHYGGQELRGEIDAFAVEGANKLVGNEGFETSAETATVTVSNCVSDDATLYVANVQVDSKPSGGMVTLDNVAVGSEIRIEANVEGATQVARVVFNDINETSLAFGEYSSTGSDSGAEEENTPEDNGGDEALARAQSMSASDINGVLGTFYRSYLTSINDQTTNTLQNSTSANNADMAERITSSNNAGYLFEYLGVNVNASTIVASADNGVPKLAFTADFTYRYTPREGGDTEDGGNTQNVTMIYEEGEWRVHSMERVE